MPARSMVHLRHARLRRGFTLTEIMVSMTILMIVTAGVLYGHIAGLKMYGLTKAKLGASDMARNAINGLISEIRSAKSVAVGNGSLTDFVECTNSAPHQGNAVLIYPGTDTNNWIKYYLEETTKKLLRTTNGATSREIVAEFITNRVVFTAEDYSGAVITDSQNNRVVGLALQFYQVQYPITPIGTPGAYFDYYQIRTKVTRRTLE